MTEQQVDLEDAVADAENADADQAQTKPPRRRKAGVAAEQAKTDASPDEGDSEAAVEDEGDSEADDGEAAAAPAGDAIQVVLQPRHRQYVRQMAKQSGVTEGKMVEMMVRQVWKEDPSRVAGGSNFAEAQG